MIIIQHKYMKTNTYKKHFYNVFEALHKLFYLIIGLHVNAHKTEYMCYNQTGNIATLDGASLKLVDNSPT